MPPRWPTFVIAGPPRAGTTSLHRYLGEHPDVFMSPVKETRFFDHRWDAAEGDPEALAEAEAWYLDLFDEAGDAAAVGESTPTYLAHPDVPSRLREKVPDVRVLAVLRDPVERLHSQYLFGVRQGSEDRPFPAYVEDRLARDADPDRGPDAAVQAGRYHDNLTRFADALGRDRVRVLLFDDLRDDPLSVLRDIAAFLDVDPGPMADVDHGRVHNPYGEPRGRLAAFLRTDPRVRRVARWLLPKRVRIWLGEEVLLRKPDKPAIEAEALERLRPVYADDLDRLEAWLGRDLPELRRTWGDGG